MFSTLHGNGDLLIEENDRPLFISLGSHCEVAVKLRENKLRQAAFPFDWIHTFIHEGFLSILDEDFLFFLDKTALFQHPTYPHVLENRFYQIEFRHDWPFDTLDTNPNRYIYQLEKLTEKYRRRIARFRKLKEHRGKVFFIRAAFDMSNDPNVYWKRKGIDTITPIQARELRNRLDLFFPGLDFTLVIINYKEEQTPPFEPVNGIVEFKIRKLNKHEDYAALFNLLINLHQMNQCLAQ